MKIAMFHELHVGGARRSVNEFSKRLKVKHQVDLYLVDEIDNEKERSFFTNVFFYRFIPKKWTGGDWKTKFYKDTIELYHLYKLHKKIAAAIDSKQYDVIFVEPSRFTQAPFILRFLKTKKIYYCQESLRMVYEPLLGIKNLSIIKYCYERINRYIRKIIDKRNISYADKILVNSAYTKSNVKKAYNLESTVNYMGVDTDVFKPVKIQKDIDILFIGAYAFADGYTSLEEAKKYLPSNLQIKVLASEKQWITNDGMMRELYCRSKIVLALGYNEPFGLIPLEAMSCEVPVVVVNEGGYKESVVDGKTGFLLPRKAKTLAKKITWLLSHKKERDKLGKTARKMMINNWRWEKRTSELEKAFANTSSALYDKE